MDKHGWLWWRKGDVAIEREQMADEGRDPSVLATEFAALEALDDDTQAFQDRFNGLLDAVQKLPASGERNEPSSLDAIRALRPAKRPGIGKARGDFKDRLYGAWLGRCAGCLLGKPIEGWRREHLWRVLKESGHDMITDYLWRMPIDESIFERYGAKANGGGTLLEFGRGISQMPEDDDTNYTVTGLALIRQKGLDFTPDDMATFWMKNIPILHTCTAERVAYRNFVAGTGPGDSAVTRNPYREWIGAQIRADFFGYVAPGNPELSAELAWRDASISHVRNGIYGEMWVAAMLAAAAVEEDRMVILEAGLAQIPAASRLTRDIRTIMTGYEDGVSYADAVKKIHERWNEANPHHWCHTNSNAQIVALGLLYGEGDFEKTVTYAVYPCFDTDCNGATAGSVLGMVLGAKALPAKWTELMCDTLLSGVDGYQRVAISRLAEETLALAVRA